MSSPEALLTPAELLMHRLHEQAQGALIISSAARFKGCLSEAALAQALATLQQRHAALRVAIHDEKNAASFVDRPVPPAIPLEWRETQTDDEWTQAILELAREPFDVRQGALHRLLVLYHPVRQQTDVLMASHHAVADGRSRVELMRELALLCAGDSLPPASDSINRPFPYVPTAQGLFRPILSAIAYGFSDRRVQKRFPLVEIAAERPSSEVLQRSVWTLEATRQLREAARHHQTTVSGALLAAALLELFAREGLTNRSARVRMPLDLRSLCQPTVPGDAQGCYAATLDFLVAVQKDQPFWTLARSARDLVQQRFLDTGLWAAGWRLLGGLLNRGRVPDVRAAFVNLNNLGVVPPIVTSTARMTEFSWTVNQQQMAMSLMFAAATVEGVLNLTIRTPWHTAQETAAIQQGILQRLEQASGIS